MPLLQFALSRIWEGLREDIDPAQTLKDIKGVGGALASEAQRIFDSLNKKEKAITKRVFLGLVQLGEGAKDTRRRIQVKKLVAHTERLEEVKKVIDRFAGINARLISLSCNNNQNEIVEVTHEALFTHWNKLNEWLDRGRDDLRFQRRLENAIEYWAKSNKQKGSLWRSPDLELLQDYYLRAKQNFNEFSEIELEFLEQCERETTKILLLQETLGWMNNSIIIEQLQNRIWEKSSCDNYFQVACERAKVLNDLLKQIKNQELLSWILNTFWDATENPIDRWERSKGIGGLFAEKADILYKTFDKNEQKIIQKVFLRLIEPGCGTEDKIRSVSIECLSNHKNKKKIEKILTKFSSKNVRTIIWDKTKKEVRISNAELLKHWGKLTQWLNANRDDIPFHRRLENEALNWNNNFRPESRLWGSSELKLLQDYYLKSQQIFNQSELDFYRASLQQEKKYKQKNLTVSTIISTLTLTIISSVLTPIFQIPKESLNLAESTTTLVTGYIETELERNLQSAWQVNKRFSSLIKTKNLDLKKTKQIEAYLADTIEGLVSPDESYLNERGFFWGSSKGDVIGIIYNTKYPLKKNERKATFWRTITETEYQNLEIKNKKEITKSKCQSKLSFKNDSSNVIELYDIVDLQTREKVNFRYIRYDPRKRDWYIEGAESNEQTWSKTYKFCENGELGISPLFLTKLFKKQNY